jgi:hypothetical protein
MIGRYDEEIREGLEDWEYMLRAMSKRLWGGTRTSLPSLHVLYLSPLSLSVVIIQRVFTSTHLHGTVAEPVDWYRRRENHLKDRWGNFAPENLKVLIILFGPLSTAATATLHLHLHLHLQLLVSLLLLLMLLLLL